MGLGGSLRRLHGGGRGRCARIRAGLGGRFGRCAARLCRFILARAFGLQHSRVEHAITAVRPLRQSLRIILERVRRRLGSLVRHLERAAFRSLERMALELIHHKRHMRAVALNRTRLHEAFHAQLALIGLVAQAAQFCDGYVIAFVGVISGHGQQPIVPTTTAAAMPIRSVFEEIFIVNSNHTSGNRPGQPSKAGTAFYLDGPSSK